MACWSNRKNLPCTAAGFRKPVQPAIGLRAKITDRAGARKRGYVEQHPAGASPQDTHGIVIAHLDYSLPNTHLEDLKSSLFNLVTRDRLCYMDATK